MQLFTLRGLFNTLVCNRVFGILFYLKDLIKRKINIIYKDEDIKSGVICTKGPRLIYGWAISVLSPVFVTETLWDM